MGMAGEKSLTVTLTPAVRPRPALASHATAMAEDVMMLPSGKEEAVVIASRQNGARQEPTRANAVDP